MTSRLYCGKDYQALRGWWHGHGQPSVPKSVLPECGVVVVEGKKRLAAVWLYMDNTRAIGWLAWLVTNPGISPMLAAKAIKEALGASEAVARSQNRKLLFTMTERASLGRLFQREGFVPNHSGMTQYFRRID